MSRLQSELSRLYFGRRGSLAESDVQSADPIDPSDGVRALVMELARPPDWAALSRVWRGVQTELELPAPAIAVSGVDGLQLWFSLAEPIAIAQAHTFLECLRLRFLSDVESSRLRLMPDPDAAALHQAQHAPLVPARQETTGNWSAFLAPDLVPVFADSPWLDIPPNEEGQANLLRGIEVTTQAEFEAAAEKIAMSTPTSPAPASVVANAPEPAVRASAATIFTNEDPKLFLVQVMKDTSVALALRIEAAKVLLQHASEPRSPQVK